MKKKKRTMTILHFPQFEHELFWKYFKRLSAFLTWWSYCLGRWEILDIIDDGVNSKTWTLLDYWDFHCKNVDDPCYLLECIVWDSFEFEKVTIISKY